MVTDSATVIVRGAADIRLVWTELSDNGDHDGFADSNETVALRLGLLNTGDVDLSNVTGRITTDDTKIDCVLQATIYVGDLAAGEERVTDQAFVVRVADVDRTTAGLTDLDDFSVRFEAAFTSDSPTTKKTAPPASRARWRNMRASSPLIPVRYAKSAATPERSKRLDSA